MDGRRRSSALLACLTACALLAAPAAAQEPQLGLRPQQLAVSP